MVVGALKSSPMRRAGRAPEDIAFTCDVAMARDVDRGAGEHLAHHIRDLARSCGRKAAMTDCGVDGVLHDDGNGMFEQLQRLSDAGCSAARARSPSHNPA